MELTNFRGMYIAELQELVSAERQLVASLLRMSAAASHPTLRSALHHRPLMCARRSILVRLDELQSVAVRKLLNFGTNGWAPQSSSNAPTLCWQLSAIRRSGTVSHAGRARREATASSKRG
jgi:Domain of unknown function (DUF892)